MKPTAQLLVALAALAAGCSRPPHGMRRLDSGSSNHDFAIDMRRRRLFYVEGGGDRVTRLGVVDLESGRRRSYRFSPEHIVGFTPSFHEDAVTVAVVAASGPNAGRYELLKVDADSGGVLAQEPRTSVSAKDLLNFGEPVPLDDGDDAAPRLAPSGPPSSEPDGGETTFGAKPIGGAHPGVKLTVLHAGRRSVRFFPTPTEPDNVVISPDDRIYASYRAKGDVWRVEELDAASGARRPIASFSGQVESMAYAGQGLVLLRRGDGGAGPRRLDMIDAAAGRVALELPWSDGESEIIKADTGKRLLYVQMNEGEAQSCWAIHFDEAALRSASAYLAAARGPTVRKITETDIVALVMIAGLIALLVAILAAAWG